MDNVLKILSAVISWPTVVLVVALVFSRQIKGVLEILTKRRASLKLPGNIELSLEELQDHAPNEPVRDKEARFSDAVSTVISKLPNKSPESIKAALNQMLADHRKADLNLYLRTMSYQLLAWLHFHRSGEPFGLGDLLAEDHIPIQHDGEKRGAYCIHSAYEKEAVAAEFKRNYWNLKRYGVIESVNEKQVRILNDPKVLDALSIAMEEIYRTEHERHAISSFVEKFLETPEEEATKIVSGISQSDLLPKPGKP